MTLATSRGARQQRIIGVLAERTIKSQVDLLEILAAEGIEVTQATLSRDLVELGAEKVRVGKDLIYALPGEGGDRTVRAAPERATHYRSRPIADHATWTVASLVSAHVVTRTTKFSLVTETTLTSTRAFAALPTSSAAIDTCTAGSRRKPAWNGITASISRGPLPVHMYPFG